MLYNRDLSSEPDIFTLQSVRKSNPAGGRINSHAHLQNNAIQLLDQTGMSERASQLYSTQKNGDLSQFHNMDDPFALPKPLFKVLAPNCPRTPVQVKERADSGGNAGGLCGRQDQVMRVQGLNVRMRDKAINTTSKFRGVTKCASRLDTLVVLPHNASINHPSVYLSCHVILQ